MPKQTHEFQLNRWRWPMALLVALILAATLGVPLFNLIYKAGVIVEPTASGVVRSWSIAKAAHIVAESPLRFSKETGWSVLTALGAASATLLISLPLAWLARRGTLAAAPAVFLGAAALAVPAPLLAIGLIQLLNNPDLPWLGSIYHTIFAPMIAQTIRALPLTLFITWLAFRTIGDEQFEAAALDGAGSWTRFLRIAVPQRLPALASAWAAAFIIAFNELPATLLLEAPGRMTLPIAVYQLMHGTGEDRLAGIALCMVVGYAVIGAVAVLAINWFGRSSHFDASQAKLS